jgi:SPASM domain peptide maturase of grasp-with-spasm system
MDEKIKYIRLFETCRLVKGFRRSAVYDLGRRNFLYIPNALYKILHNNRGILKENFYLDYDTKYREVIKEYIDFLFSEQMVFYCDEQNLNCFTRLNTTWKHPAIITNAIIYLHENLRLLDKIIDDLRFLSCKDLLFIESVFDYDDLKLLSTQTIDSDVSSMTLYLPYHNNIDIDWLITYLKENKRIKKIHLYSSSEMKHIYVNEAQLQEIDMVKYDASSCFRCSKQEGDLNINTPFYFESLSYNSCLNRKISIDAKGDIKNCPSLNKILGNIRETTLSDVVKNSDFTILWNITKDKIDVCKNCELRYACEDCRCHIKDKNNIYSQPSRCTYNPYIAKWTDEDGYVPVEDCGTYSKETGFVPDKKKIATLNKQIWGEDE